MRCETVKRWLSDDRDGALAPERRVRLEAHLRECRDCRGYRVVLSRIQAGTPPVADRSPEYWSAFERRLESKLDDVESIRGPARAPLFAGRRWAWAAAGFLVMAAVGVYFAVRRPAGALETAWVPYQDPLAQLLMEAEADPEVENLVNRELLASLSDADPDADGDDGVLVASDPLFWEGLSEEELEYIAAELERETGNGGPK